MEVEDLATASETLVSPVHALDAPYDRQRLEDVGFMTCMTLVLLGNYSQTGHFGGPLAYTPYNVATHLAGPDAGRPAVRLPAARSIPTPTSSCSPAGTASRPATRCG